MSDDFVRNLKEPSHWLRVFFMVGFAIVLYVLGMVILVITLAQLLFSLLTGTDNLNLRALGASLSSYVYEILQYLTYNSEARPFPFAPFPYTEPTPANAHVEPEKPASADVEPEPPASADEENPR